MSTTGAPGPKFEYRYYEAMRRAALAPAIGVIGVEGVQAAQLQKLKKRRKVELQSTLAEGLRPDNIRSIIDTHYPIEMVDGRLVATDDEPLEDMLNRALVEDTKLADQDEFFAEFLPQVARHELNELHQWEAMVRGETGYNTLVTLSPYREEYDDGSDEVHQKLMRAAQKPYWRRGMFRVAHARDGKLHVFNYSVDNSSVELMAQAAKEKLGYEFQAKNSVDMLGERIPLQIDDDSWRFIAPGLVAETDNILAERHGGIWRHGYNPEAGIRRAQAFVESQTHIVDSLISLNEQLASKYSTFETYSAAFELKLYDCLALLEKRLELGREDELIVDYEAASGGAGSMARSEGKTYDACGMIIGHGQTESASASQKTGFESLKRLENKKISCYACKNEVVVPKRDLDKGRLSCKHCGYWLDVCTGKSGFRKGFEKMAQKTFDAFDILAAGIRRAGAEIRRSKWLAKRKTVQTNSEKKQIDLLVMQEEAEIEQLKMIA